MKNESVGEKKVFLNLDFHGILKWSKWWSWINW